MYLGVWRKDSFGEALDHGPGKGEVLEPSVSARAYIVNDKKESERLWLEKEKERETMASITSMLTPSFSLLGVVSSAVAGN